MKKMLWKILSCVLVLTLIFSFSAPAAQAEGSVKDIAGTIDFSQVSDLASFSVTVKKLLSEYVTKLMDLIVNQALLGSVSKALPNLSFVKDANEPVSAENFYEGTKTFLATESNNTTWKIGYASESIIPDDFGTWFKYARGSYSPWGYSTDFYKDEEGIDEGLKVRTIIIDDMTGRGLNVISAVDCIGISNTDVQKIRAAVKDFAKEVNIVSMNISATHCHMSIDSQGVWGSPVSTLLYNLSTPLTGRETKSGINEDYLNKIIDSTKKSIEQAYASMTEGTLEYSKLDLREKLVSRTLAEANDTNMYRLLFKPFDESRKDIYITSFGCHCEATSYDAELDTSLTADFVYYMEKLVNAYGGEFIFIQGNVGTNSAEFDYSNDGLDIEKDGYQRAFRFGYEMGYTLLGMTMNREERIALNEQLGDKLDVKGMGENEGYTPWYDGLETVEEKAVPAVLNTRNRQIRLRVDDNMALLLLKTGLATNSLAYDKETGTYYNDTEMGYMEFGNALKVFLSPGETYGELVVGGYDMKDWEYKSLKEQFGAEGTDVCVFDLMNDAAGYISPDCDYGVVALKYNGETDTFLWDSWCLMVSIGENTASVLMKNYIEIDSEARRATD